MLISAISFLPPCLFWGLYFGAFEIIKVTFWDNLSSLNLQILYFSRGVIVSLLLMIWAAWTVYNYREIYEKKIETTEGYYRDIVTHSRDAIIDLDPDGTITSWNHSAEEILGWEAEEIVGQSVKRLIPPELLNKNELQRIRKNMYSRG